MKKSLRSLIFEDDAPEVKKEQKYESRFPEASTSFPSSAPTMEAPSPTITSSVPLECAPHMDSIMKRYEEGFASLNRPGIEFYEYFEAVMEAGVNDPAAYKMALKMLSKMEKTMTKDSLAIQSQFYIDELNKVHAGFSSQGVTAKTELMTAKDSEGLKLKNDIQLLKDQMESLRNQLGAKEIQLSQIDGRYQPKINELECKIMANDTAKNRILGSINAVVAGIKANL